MPTPDKPRKQRTRPQGTDEHGKRHEPIEIPVPKREDFDRLVKKAAKPKRPS